MPETTVSINRLRLVAAETSRLGNLIGTPFPQWAHRCHEISLKLLRTGEFGAGRIARGMCAHVPGQHSWIVLGNDCYDPDATIVDPTLWSYTTAQTGIFVGRNMQWHRPHGTGFYMEAPMPCIHDGENVELADPDSLSDEAWEFLEELGLLDLRGWGEVAHLPVGGWPAAEIITAMDDTPSLRALVPIDRLGMLTDRNPGGVYR